MLLQMKDIDILEKMLEAADIKYDRLTLEPHLHCINVLDYMYGTVTGLVIKFEFDSQGNLTALGTNK